MSEQTDPKRGIAGPDFGIKVGGVAWVLALNMLRFLRRESANALLRFPCVLHILHGALFVHPFECVDGEAIHLAVIGRNTQIGVEEREHLSRLRDMRKEIEEAVGVLLPTMS